MQIEMTPALGELRPHAVAMEEAFFSKNVQSTLALGEARGVALFVAMEHGLTVTGYTPATVKQTVVGHGRATKDQIGYLVRALLSLRRIPEADASAGWTVLWPDVATSAAGATFRLRFHG